MCAELLNSRRSDIDVTRGRIQCTCTGKVLPPERVIRTPANDERMRRRFAAHVTVQRCGVTIVALCVYGHPVGPPNIMHACMQHRAVNNMVLASSSCENVQCII
jgi:hypothetical protein